MFALSLRVEIKQKKRGCRSLGALGAPVARGLGFGTWGLGLGVWDLGLGAGGSGSGSVKRFTAEHAENAEKSVGRGAWNSPPTLTCLRLAIGYAEAQGEEDKKNAGSGGLSWNRMNLFIY